MSVYQKYETSLEGVDLRTFWVQHTRNVEVFFSNIEGSVEILKRIVLGEFVVVDEIWAVAVDEGAESQTVFEAENSKQIMRYLT